MDVGNQIRFYRKEKQLSQMALAEKLMYLRKRFLTGKMREATQTYII